MKHVRTAFLSAAIFLGSISSAQAICYFPPSANPPKTGNHYIYTVVQKVTTLYHDPNSVEIGKSFGLIQLVMQSNAYYPSQPGRLICGGGSNTLQLTGMGNPINGNIYPSNIPGIGLRITVDDYPYASSAANTTTQTTYPRIIPYSYGYSRPNKFAVKIDLIRTGQASCSGPFVGTFAQDMMDGQVLGEFRF
ncbi:Uncharacterised protein [Delftia tsuruhatensis]|uniref:hypothetical protein n=1 Tax=Delftia tsuruhatensis TaxID=180282 RepID=UPI001E7D2D5C|nr:hypothetical protein [Delftia tsuruhatensis]CAB5715426.1 Uncharacterised protein [Delftia tsuruhatensis]CAC9676722.1 Uncharacterised protein [Delftia tsuruhatensis]